MDQNFDRLNTCNNCIHYTWYTDYCDKWQCEVDWSACCREYKPFPNLKYLKYNNDKNKD